MYNLKIGANHTAEKLVEERDTAAFMGSGAVEVFATPAMILLMELAARNAVQADLPEGTTTVGTLVDVRHMAATPLAAKVSATAILKEIDGRKLIFDVEAADENGVIGKGVHERAIIDIRRFMAKLVK
ncbi:MAG: thioesterase family protein [Clostridiales bacterium]|jgi:predicted thioesterase|nr:thioesterase family protein [Clostridiales bacterium]